MADTVTVDATLILSKYQNYYGTDRLQSFSVLMYMYIFSVIIL